MSDRRQGSAKKAKAVRRCPTCRRTSADARPSASVPAWLRAVVALEALADRLAKLNRQLRRVA